MCGSVNLPSTSLIIPVHNGGDAFKQCLAWVARLDPQPDAIIIVDDGSTDDSASAAKAAGYRVISSVRPVGPAGARNTGAAHSAADILVFLDADTTPPAGYMADAVRMLSQDPGLAAVIGSYDDAPGADGFLSQYRNLLHHHTHQNSSEQAATFWGACGAIKREIFNELGGFDESLRYLEDVELGLRLNKAGYRVRLAKHWQVKHWKGYTAGSLIHTDVMQRALPWTRLALRGHGLINDLNTKLSHRVSVALSFLILLLLPVVLFTPWAWIALLSAFGGFIVINRNFYGFIRRKKNIRFAVLTVFWHWVHHLSAGTGMALGIMDYCFKAARKSLSLSRVKQTI